MPLLFVRLHRLFIPPLVILKDRTDVFKIRNPTPPPKHQRDPLVQGTAYLLRRYLRIFPPEAAPFA